MYVTSMQYSQLSPGDYPYAPANDGILLPTFFQYHTFDRRHMTEKQSKGHKSVLLIVSKFKTTLTNQNCSKPILLVSVYCQLNLMETSEFEH